jgi:hypothetical protein
MIEFIPKKRVVAQTPEGDASPTPKNQKRFFEDVQKGLVDKVRERGSRGMDPNFHAENGGLLFKFNSNE